MRKGCRTSKNETKCPRYSYDLGRCKDGLVKATCSLCEQPKPGTKAFKQAQQVRAFYGYKLPVQDEGVVTTRSGIIRQGLLWWLLT